MSTNLEWLTEQDTVQTAAEKMTEAGVGFLPICDAERRVVGVVTDRDLVTRGLARKVVPGTTPIALIMTSPVLSCLDTADLREAEALMATAQKSRLVVTDAQARVVGVLSLADLLEHAPTADALQTTRAVLWREALGPRGGARPGVLLLKDDAVARAVPPPSDSLDVRETAFKGGHHSTGTKEFPTP